MARALVVSQSRVVPGEPDQSFRLLPLLPLDVVYRHWYGVIPPIRQVIYVDGEWSRVGQKRTMVLWGGSAVAEVTHVNAPRSFGYQLSHTRGLLAPLIRRVDGRVDFEPVADGTRLRWQWTIYPRSVLASLPLAVFARLWPGWALKALDYMADEIARGL